MRYICTKDDPWTEEKGRAIHPEAEYVNDRYYGGDEYCELYHCPHCGKYFEVELPR